MIDISPFTGSLSLRGKLIQPNDPAYDSARTVFPGGIDKKPALIVRVQNTNDIATVIKLARMSHADISVKSGGHSNGGYGVVDGGVVIDLSLMKAIDINTSGKYAWAETGMTASEYTKETGTLSLATGFGDTGTVGIGGITLGGGIGYLVRKYGLTIDDVLAADIVTADGRLLRIDATQYEDLFWAIRGGGGNFGVVTRFKYRVHSLDTVVGGMLILPATPETITTFIHYADTASDDLTTIANVMTAPPLPFLPKEYYGKVILMAMLCYAGDTKKGEKVMQKFRNIAHPLADMIHTMPYPDMYPPEQSGYRPISASRTMFIDKVDIKNATTILHHLEKSTGKMSVTQIRVLGGAVSRVPKAETAFAHRHSEIMVNLASLYEKPDEKEIHEAWVNTFESSLRQSDKGAYVNFLGLEEKHKIRTAYPGKTWERLVEIKKKYDPDNMFHNTQNIPPSTGSTIKL